MESDKSKEDSCSFAHKCFIRSNLVVAQNSKIEKDELEQRNVDFKNNEKAAKYLTHIFSLIEKAVNKGRFKILYDIRARRLLLS